MLATNNGAQVVNAFLEEAIEEAFGTSPRKWALVLLALVAGALGALWLTRRRRPIPSAATAGARST